MFLDAPADLCPSPEDDLAAASVGEKDKLDRWMRLVFVELAKAVDIGRRGGQYPEHEDRLLRLHGAVAHRPTIDGKIRPADAARRDPDSDVGRFGPAWAPSQL